MNRVGTRAVISLIGAKPHPRFLEIDERQIALYREADLVFLRRLLPDSRAEEINMQFYQPMHGQDFKELSRAIQAWCRHFNVDVEERETAVLCRAAIELFNQGNRGASALADALVKMYPGPQMLLINAPGSNSLH